MNLDDNAIIYRKEVIQGGLSVRIFNWALTHTVVSNWHPLTTLSHMFDCQLYGLNAATTPTRAGAEQLSRGSCLYSKGVAPLCAAQRFPPGIPTRLTPRADFAEMCAANYNAKSL